MPNSLVEHQFPVLQETLALRPQMLDLLSDDDLSFALPGNPTLGQLLGDMLQTDGLYVDSFQQFTMTWPNTPAATATSVDQVREAIERTDGDLQSAMCALSEDDVQSRTIDRGGDFVVPVGVQLHIYRESILILCGKISTYLRALKKEFPEQWRLWIG